MGLNYYKIKKHVLKARKLVIKGTAAAASGHPGGSFSMAEIMGCLFDEVTRIVDGDTIYTDTLKIRLSLTNTPEKNQVGFSEAAQFTEMLCPVGSRILIDQDDLQRVDDYGRVLAKVFCGDKVLNSELLYNGACLTKTTGGSL